MSDERPVSVVQCCCCGLRKTYRQKDGSSLAEIEKKQHDEQWIWQDVTGGRLYWCPDHAERKAE